MSEEKIKAPEACYKVLHVQTESNHYPYHSLDAIGTALKEGYIILWQHHAIFAGSIKNEEIKWLSAGAAPERETRHIVRLRAFNEKQEVHVWRSGSELKGRWREDNPAIHETLCPVVDTAMILRGIIAESLVGLSDEYKKTGFLRINTRNYIGYNEMGQAGYVDSRFVGFN